MLPPAFASLTFRFVQCATCGLVYLRERPDPADVGVYYPDNYKCFVSYAERGLIMKALAERVARGKLKQINRLMPEGNDTILDYGCGSGTWLAMLRDIGCTVQDDRDRHRRRPARRVATAWSGKAYQCDDATLGRRACPRQLGVVHLFHVIEHLPNADRVLRSIRDALTPGGVVIGQTPNIASVGRRFWADDWNQWHAPQHLVLFFGRHAQAARGESRIRGRPHLELHFRSDAVGALSALHRWARFRGRPFRSIHDPWYPPLILAWIPIVLLEAALSRTCHMDFVLRKPA